MRLKVPKNSKPGDTITFDSDAGRFVVHVPEGATAGKMMSIIMPVASKFDGKTLEAREMRVNGKKAEAGESSSTDAKKVEGEITREYLRAVWSSISNFDAVVTVDLTRLPLVAFQANVVSQNQDC